MNDTVTVWPVRGHGQEMALSRVTFAGMISVYPIVIMEGKRGLQLSFKRTKTSFNREKAAIAFCNESGREYISQEVLTTYHPNKPASREFVRKGNIEIAIKVDLCEIQPDYLVGTATMEIDRLLRISDIRLFCYPSGTRLILYPERVVWKDGDFEFKRVVEFRENMEQQIELRIWDKYERKEGSSNDRTYNDNR